MVRKVVFIHDRLSEKGANLLLNSKRDDTDVYLTKNVEFAQPPPPTSSQDSHLQLGLIWKKPNAKKTNRKYIIPFRFGDENILCTAFEQALEPWDRVDIFLFVYDALDMYHLFKQFLIDHPNVYVHMSMDDQWRIERTYHKSTEKEVNVDVSLNQFFEAVPKEISVVVTTYIYVPAAVGTTKIVISDNEDDDNGELTGDLSTSINATNFIDIGTYSEINNLEIIYSGDVTIDATCGIFGQCNTVPRTFKKVIIKPDPDPEKTSSLNFVGEGNGLLFGTTLADITIEDCQFEMTEANRSFGGVIIGCAFPKRIGTDLVVTEAYGFIPPPIVIPGESFQMFSCNIFDSQDAKITVEHPAITNVDFKTTYVEKSNISSDHEFWTTVGDEFWTTVGDESWTTVGDELTFTTTTTNGTTTTDIIYQKGATYSGGLDMVNINFKASESDYPKITLTTGTTLSVSIVKGYWQHPVTIPYHTIDNSNMLPPFPCDYYTSTSTEQRESYQFYSQYYYDTNWNGVFNGFIMNNDSTSNHYYNPWNGFVPEDVIYKRSISSDDKIMELPNENWVVKYKNDIILSASKTYTISKDEAGGFVIDDNGSKIYINNTVHIKLSNETSVLGSLSLSGEFIGDLSLLSIHFVCEKIESIPFINDNIKGCVTNIEVTGEFKDIPAECFKGYSKIVTASFPEMTGSIMTRAFTVSLDSGCPIISADFPKMKGGIGEGAFLKCNALISVDCPKMEGKIGLSAFHYCTALITVNFPEMIGSMAYNVFKSCNKLKTVNCPKMIGSVASYVFDGCTNLKLLDLSSNKTPIHYSMVDLTKTALSYGGSDIDFSDIVEDFEFYNIVAPKQSKPNTITYSGKYIFADDYGDDSNRPWIPENQYSNIDWCKITSNNITTDPSTDPNVVTTKDNVFKTYVNTLSEEYKNYLDTTMSGISDLDTDVMYVITADGVVQSTIEPSNSIHIYFNVQTVSITIGSKTYQIGSDEIPENIRIFVYKYNNTSLLVFYHAAAEAAAEAAATAADAAATTAEAAEAVAEAAATEAAAEAEVAAAEAVEVVESDNAVESANAAKAAAVNAKAAAVNAEATAVNAKAAATAAANYADVAAAAASEVRVAANDGVVNNTTADAANTAAINAATSANAAIASADAANDAATSAITSGNAAAEAAAAEAAAGGNNIALYIALACIGGVAMLVLFVYFMWFR